MINHYLFYLFSPFEEYSRIIEITPGFPMVADNPSKLCRLLEIQNEWIAGH